MANPKNAKSTLNEQVARLSAEVHELKGQLQALRGGPPSNGNGHQNDQPRSRRDVLRMAGVAAVGAAGALVVRGTTSADALTGQPIVMGVTNDSGVTTNLIPTTGTAPAPLFQSYGQGATTSPVAPLNGTQSVPLIGAIGAGGSLPPIGNPPVNDYPGFAPIQGVGGIATIATPGGGSQQVSEGLNGFGFGDTGIGVTGESDTGYGLVGGSGGIDIAALGNGRLLQVVPVDALLSNPPAGPPNYVPNDFERVVDGNGVVWVSQQAPSGSPASAYWRRLNSTIPITPTRIIDTRNGTGGITGPLAANTTYTWGPIPGATIQGGPKNGQSNGVDAHAIGIVGNVTATGFSGNGYLAVFPAGTAYDPSTSPSTMNYSDSAWAWANAFTSLLGTGANAGKISVRIGLISTHLVMDIVAYLI